jgi:hypothetical protein
MPDQLDGVIIQRSNYIIRFLKGLSLVVESVIMR